METFSLKDPFAWEFFACPHFKSDIRKQNRRSHVKLHNILFFKKEKMKWNEMRMKPCVEWWDEDEWHENEALNLIMLMVKHCTKKNNQQIYLQKKNKKIKTSLLPSLPPFV